MVWVSLSSKLFLDWEFLAWGALLQRSFFFARHHGELGRSDEPRESDVIASLWSSSSTWGHAIAAWTPKQLCISAELNQNMTLCSASVSKSPKRWGILSVSDSLFFPFPVKLSFFIFEKLSFIVFGISTSGTHKSFHLSFKVDLLATILTYFSFSFTPTNFTSFLLFSKDFY